MKLPRIVIAGAQSGVGKTTISLGLMAAFRKRGLRVQPYKTGPDYIDPAYHSYVTGNKCRNLDSWMLDKDTIKYLFNKNAINADISIIEGVMGLYDGFGVEKDSGSTAHVSKIINAPVILIINGQGISTSAAAMVLGYKLYDPDINIKGIIINKVSGQKHFEILKQVIERDTGIPALGYIPNNGEISLSSRHLGLVPSVEMEDLDKKIEKISQMIEEYIDLDRLIGIAQDSSEITHIANPILHMERFDNVKIGVAYDKAFNFYYQDNLELLEQLGVKLIYFSPLEDKELPEDIAGLYIGGGFPEVFAETLQLNESMRLSIKKGIGNGLPTYAECGGLMYLTDSIQDFKGRTYKMVGVLPGKSRMTTRLQRFGYVNVELERDCVIGKEGNVFRAHEFHRSVVDIRENDLCYKVTKIKNGEVFDSWQCGYQAYNMLAGYAHIHFWSNLEIPKHFMMSCYKYSKRLQYDKW